MLNPFKKTFTKREQQLFVYLSKIELFSELNYKEMALFLPHLHERSYEHDEVVFFRNDPSHALYLLKSGSVKLSIDVNNVFETLTDVEGAVALGESCLIPGVKRQLNAFVSSENAEFYVLAQENILAIFEGNMKIKTKMLESLAKIYNNYNSRLFKAYQASEGFFNLRQLYH